MINFITTVLILGVIVMQTVSAGAQNIRNSSVDGRVEGSLVQIARDQGDSEVNIGAIITDRNQDVHDVHTQAHVKGDVHVNVSGAAVKVNIGSVNVRR